MFAFCLPFSRLSEQYTLNAQLFCHQESLLPGQAVPLLLQLVLQMHGRPAPLQLLQDVTLRLTATTQEGADVTQVGACNNQSINSINYTFF
jgi:hypothetical protein